METIPLIVDLDGTLLRSDLLIETGLLFLRDRPLQLPSLVRWLTQGKTTLKRELSRATRIDVTTLPYEESVIRFIERERGSGRQVVLATASYRGLAEQVSAHLGIFDEVIATDDFKNLAGTFKRDALVQKFGTYGFDYVGNSTDDLAVWGAARHAYVANASPKIERQVRELGGNSSALVSKRFCLSDWAKALRLHQWLKNLLVFVPLLAAHRFDELGLVVDAVSAFLCFSICASSVYVLNDLLDLRDDRYHTTKRLRPFASGRLSIQSGLAVVPLLLGVAFGFAAWKLPLSFTFGLATYYLLTVCYSFSLKRLAVIDVITLGGLYTMRVVCGALALNISLSLWLLSFSMFIFLSLALLKRYAELFQIHAIGTSQKARGRGYSSDHLRPIAYLGFVSGCVSVLVLAFYINDFHTAKLYRHPDLIWIACPLLFGWIGRVWILAHRGSMNEDPVIFASQDLISLCIGSLLALTFWSAT